MKQQLRAVAGTSTRYHPVPPPPAQTPLDPLHDGDISVHGDTAPSPSLLATNASVVPVSSSQCSSRYGSLSMEETPSEYGEYPEYFQRQDSPVSIKSLLDYDGFSDTCGDLGDTTEILVDGDCVPELLARYESDSAIVDYAGFLTESEDDDGEGALCRMTPLRDEDTTLAGEFESEDTNAASSHADASNPPAGPNASNVGRESSEPSSALGSTHKDAGEQPIVHASLECSSDRNPTAQQARTTISFTLDVSSKESALRTSDIGNVALLNEFLLQGGPITDLTLSLKCPCEADMVGRRREITRIISGLGSALSESLRRLDVTVPSLELTMPYYPEILGTIVEQFPMLEHVVIADSRCECSHCSLPFKSAAGFKQLLVYVLEAEMQQPQVAVTYTPPTQLKSVKLTRRSMHSFGKDFAGYIGNNGSRLDELLLGTLEVTRGISPREATARAQRESEFYIKSLRSRIPSASCFTVITDELHVTYTCPPPELDDSSASSYAPDNRWESEGVGEP
ncbi:hypothetical protein BD309DRAFT_1019111 [Dichomitus squalens]|nr:hypothetical protein BD309DRAFT_1019111 [Dichomitus squalens]